MGAASIRSQPIEEVKMILEIIKGERRKRTAVCECDTCHKQFLKPEWYVKSYPHQFCQRQCKDKFQSLMMQGNKSNLGKGHPSTKHHSQGENNPMFGVHRYGEENGNWKGGIKKTDTGYILIYRPKHPNAINDKYVFEHRLIMEEFLNRFLTKKEIVHHINKDKTDNRIENLMLFPNHSEHRLYHTKQKALA